MYVKLRVTLTVAAKSGATIIETNIVIASLAVLLALVGVIA
jgi:hypothetical protein